MLKHRLHKAVAPACKYIIRFVTLTSGSLHQAVEPTSTGAERCLFFAACLESSVTDSLAILASARYHNSGWNRSASMSLSVARPQLLLVPQAAGCTCTIQPVLPSPCSETSHGFQLHPLATVKRGCCGVHAQGKLSFTCNLQGGWCFSTSAVMTTKPCCCRSLQHWPCQNSHMRKCT